MRSIIIALLLTGCTTIKNNYYVTSITTPLIMTAQKYIKLVS